MPSNFKHWKWEDAHITEITKEGVKLQDICEAIYDVKNQQDRMALVITTIARLQPARQKTISDAITSMSATAVYRYLSYAYRLGMLEKSFDKYSLSLKFSNTIANLGKAWEIWVKEIRKSPPQVK